MSTPIWLWHRTFRLGLSLLLAAALVACFLSSAATGGERQGRPGPQPDINCFAYHRFGDDRFPSTNIDLETFRAQLELLKGNGYTVLTLGRALHQLWSDAPLPEKVAVLTVDDGYETFLTNAMPLLRTYGYPATLFVNTANVGDTGYLTWEELQRLRGEGIEIGSHSAAHPHFLDYPREQRRTMFRRDLRAAQEEFEEHLGCSPDLYSYPYGEYTPGMQGILREMGMKAAVAQKSGVIHAGSDRFVLPRFPMGGPYATLSGFKTKLTMRALPVRTASPASPVVADGGPPVLELVLDPGAVDMQGLQCFVGGERACTIRRHPDTPGKVTVQATRPLSGRRTLYTVTAPSPSGQAWHWYSHLWVRPGVGEQGH
jgi:peptidoglycan/xylan/chitin deacetylase (PgdA/CDA1 family)